MLLQPPAGGCCPHGCRYPASAPSLTLSSLWQGLGTAPFPLAFPPHTVHSRTATPPPPPSFFLTVWSVHMARRLRATNSLSSFQSFRCHQTRSVQVRLLTFDACFWTGNQQSKNVFDAVNSVKSASRLLLIDPFLCSLFTPSLPVPNRSSNNRSDSLCRVAPSGACHTRELPAWVSLPDKATNKN